MQKIVVRKGADQESVVYPVWIGPGLYGGIWFENEEDCNNW